MGVADKLKECDKMLKVKLSDNTYHEINKDFIAYLGLRADLYAAIAFKYCAKELREKAEYGKGVACYQRAINVLKDGMKGISQKKKESEQVEGIKKSMIKQMGIIKALYNEAKKRK